MLIPIYNLNDEKEHKIFIERANNGTVVSIDGVPKSMLLNVVLTDDDKDGELKVN